MASDQDSSLTEPGEERTRADSPPPRPRSRAQGPLPEGQQLGPWTLGKLLGAGAMGAVYEATRDDGTPAAIKVLLRGDDPNARKRFLREARATSRVEHPNVIHCLGSDPKAATPWIALEFVEGEDLHALLKRETKLTLDRARPLIQGILRGLRAAHIAGVVHRDLKPANVLVALDGEVKIADFGLARRDEESLAITVSGQLMGTPYYMSPEQAEGSDDVDLRSDVYAVGAILFHLFAGRPPFMGPLTEILMGHLELAPPALTELAPALPGRLAQIVQQCLEKDPTRRPHLDEVLAAFSVVGREPREVVRAAPKPKEPAPRPAPRRDRGDSERAKRLESDRVPTRKSALRSKVDPFLPPERLPEVPPVRPAPQAQPLPLGRPSRALDTIALVVLGVALIRCVDMGLGGRTLDDWALLSALRGWLTAPRFFALLGIAGLLVGERVLSRSGRRLGLLDRWLLRRRAASLATRGEVLAAARAYEQVGDRGAGATLLMRERRYEAAAKMFLDAGLGPEAGEALERAGRAAEALELYRASGSMEAAFRVALASSTPEAAAYLLRYGQVDDAVEVLLRAGRPYEAADLLEREGRLSDALLQLQERYRESDGRDYWKHIGRPGLVDDALGHLALRIAWILHKLGYPQRAAGYLEEVGEWEEAAELYAAANMREPEVRCFLEGFAEDVELTQEQRSRAAKLATELRAEDDPRAAQFLILLGRQAAAARIYEAHGDQQQAADLFAEVGMLADAARCAEEGGDAAVAAGYFADAGDHAKAGALYEQAGCLELAAEQHRAAGDRASEARVLGKLGDPLGGARALIELGREEEAVGLLSQVSGESAEHYDASLMLADLRLAAGRHEEALTLYDDCLGTGISFEEELKPHLSRIACYEGLGRIEDAIACLEQLSETPFAPEELPARISGLRAKQDKPKRAGCGPETLRIRHLRAALDLVGTSVDRYQLTELLGVGSFAWVFKAKHSSLGREVALKILKPTLASGSAPERFLREGRALAGLEHRNLIKVYDAGDYKGLSYLALELVTGPTLEKRIEASAPLPIPQATRIGVGILGGLDCAHQNGIVHRDLKPANVLLAPKDVAKVVDFGIARVIDDSSKTRTTDFLGTPRYTSPEQARGDEVEAAADQYAAALIIYELLSGRLPFTSTTTLGWLAQHMNKAPVPLEKVCPKAPKPLAAAIDKALSKSPKDRFESVVGLRQVVSRYEWKPKRRPTGRPAS